MRNIFVLGLWGSMVRRRLAEDPRLVYNQSIYTYLFDESHPNFGVYNKNSPPIRKDDMTRYYDGMEIFQHSIDKFVDHHCDPYINFLESKYLTLQFHWPQLRPVMISAISHHFFVFVTEQPPHAVGVLVRPRTGTTLYWYDLLLVQPCTGTTTWCE